MFFREFFLFNKVYLIFDDWILVLCFFNVNFLYFLVLNGYQRVKSFIVEVYIFYVWFMGLFMNIGYGFDIIC